MQIGWFKPSAVLGAMIGGHGRAPAARDFGGSGRATLIAADRAEAHGLSTPSDAQPGVARRGDPLTAPPGGDANRLPSAASTSAPGCRKVAVVGRPAGAGLAIPAGGWMPEQTIGTDTALPVSPVCWRW